MGSIYNLTPLLNCCNLSAPNQHSFIRNSVANYQKFKNMAMHSLNFDTLSEAVNTLTKNGFMDDFNAAGTKIKGSYSKKEYLPEELLIVDFYRFEGETDPQDASAVFAIEAKDGTKGTLVMSYGASHNHDVELIQKIPGVK